LENLPGYIVDLISLYNTFRQFGFDLRIFSNLSAEGLRKTLEELVGNQDGCDHSIFAGYPSLVCCILSHGGFHTVYGTDGESVDVHELQSIVDKCPDLRGKPKIFVIHTHKIYPSAPGEMVEKDEVASNKPLHPDYVRLLCNSYVYPKHGTEFVQGLCYHLRFSNANITFKCLRSIYLAYRALRQQIAKEMLARCNCLGSNPTPVIYLDTIRVGVVGFKTVSLEKRCKNIFFYANNNGSDSSYRALADFIKDAKNKADLQLYKSKYSTERLVSNSIIKIKLLIVVQ